MKPPQQRQQWKKTNLVSAVLFTVEPPNNGYIRVECFEMI